MSSDKVKAYLMIAAGLFVAYKIYQVGQATEAVVNGAVEIITEDLNPASTENIIYTTTQDIGAYLGKTVYEWTH